MRAKSISMILAIGFACIAVSCQREQNVLKDEYKYVVGVSLPNTVEPWLSDIKVEIREEIKNYPDVNVIFKDAAQSAAKQIQDMEQLMESGIDLLIVSPIEAEVLKDTIAGCYEKIPVVVLGNYVESEQYTTFIGYDDYRIGYMAGDYVVRNLTGEKTNIVLIEGPPDSIISQNRKEGFNDRLKEDQGEYLIEYLNGEWIRDKAEDRMKDYFVSNGKVNLVFALNDEMAYGACLAAEKLRWDHIDYLGVGGHTGPYGGKTLVDEGKLNATIECGNIGKEAIVKAMEILNGKKLPSRIILPVELYTANPK